MIKEFLKKIGLPGDVVEKMTAEEPVITLDEAVEAYDTDVKAVTEEQAKAAARDELKDELRDEVLIGATNSFKSKLKKAFNLEMTNSELKDLDIEVAIAKAAEQAAEHGKGEPDQWKEKAEQYKEQVIELQDKLDDEVARLKRELEQANEQATREVENYKRNQLLTKKIHDREVFQPAYDEYMELYEDSIKTWLNDNYQVELDGTIKSKDGTRAVKMSGNGSYKTVDEAIRDYAASKKFLKRSNGDSNGKPDGKTWRVKDKEVSVSTKGAEALAEALGIEND